MVNNKFFRIAIILFSGSILFNLSSCKDDPFVDIENPVISIVNIQDNALIRNNVSIEAEATDNISVDSVEFFVDGESLGAISTAPYSTSWDTNEVEDGQHTITAVAYDSFGNATEASMSVTVRNIMFKLVVEAGAITDPPNQIKKDYFILYDLEGNIINYAEVSNGNTYTFEYPEDYVGDNFHVNKLGITSSTDKVNESHYSFTYTNISPATWTLFNWGVDDRYDFSLGYNQIPSHSKYNLSTSYRFRSGSIMPNPRTISSNKPQDNVFISLETDINGPQFLWLQDVAPGLTTVDYSLLKNMEGVQSITDLSTDGIQNLTLHGYLQQGVYDEGRYLIRRGNLEPGGEIYYPTGIFNDFYTNISTSQNFKYRSKRTIGDIPTSFEDPTFDADITSASNNQIGVNTTGDFDYYNANWRYTDNSNGYVYTSFSTIAIGGNQLKRFNVPQAILDEFVNLNTAMENLEPRSVSLWEFDNYDYNDYVNNIFIERLFSPNYINFQWVISAVDPSTIGGRTNTSAETMEYFEEVEKSMLEGRLH